MDCIVLIYAITMLKSLQPYCVINNSSNMLWLLLDFYSFLKCSLIVPPIHRFNFIFQMQLYINIQLLNKQSFQCSTSGQYMSKMAR